MGPSRVRFVRTDIWREGKWLDLWSVVHFLSGISVAIGLSVFGFGFYASLVIALLVFVAYELWEAMVRIEETPQNRFMDVVVGAASFLLAHAAGIPAPWTAPFFFAFFGVLSLNVLLATFGWRASQKAALLEKRMSERLAARRAKLHARRAARGAQPPNSSPDGSVR